MTKPISEPQTSSTGGTITRFAWGLRHTAGKNFSGAAAESGTLSEAEPGVKRGRGRPRKK